MILYQFASRIDREDAQAEKHAKQLADMSWRFPYVERVDILGNKRNRDVLVTIRVAWHTITKPAVLRHLHPETVAPLRIITGTQAAGYMSVMPLIKLNGKHGELLALLRYAQDAARELGDLAQQARQALVNARALFVELGTVLQNPEEGETAGFIFKHGTRGEHDEAEKLSVHFTQDTESQEGAYVLIGAMIKTYGAQHE